MSATRSSRSRFKRWLGWTVGLPAFYVFTWGVVTACYAVGIIPEPSHLWLRTLYWPLDRL